MDEVCGDVIVPGELTLGVCSRGGGITHPVSVVWSGGGAIFL